MNQNAESHSIEAGDPAAPEHSRSAGKTDSSTPTANKKTKPETAGPQEQPDVDADPFDVEIEAAMKMLWPGTARRRPKKAGPRGAAPKTRPGTQLLQMTPDPAGLRQMHRAPRGMPLTRKRANQGRNSLIIQAPAMLVCPMQKVVTGLSKHGNRTRKQQPRA